jgi:hypothetical protein
VGEPEELSPKGRLGRAARTGERDFHGERRKNDPHVSTTS